MLVQVHLEDLKSQETLYHGLAEYQLLDTGSFCVSFGTAKEQSTWKVLKKGMLIQNESEVKTRLFLPYIGDGKANVHTPYGDMEMAISKIKCEIQTTEKEEQSSTNPEKMGKEWIKVIHLSYLLDETEYFYFQMTLNMHK
ncbi:MAG: hypothetical protein Q4A59_03915 [Erysipelotrichaceae bacterium]|nr:hypothetical protein [Erysipelotrichaceae bacterium]